MSDRVIAIDYIRGIAMLGVVGIHTGAYSLSGPAVNIHLFALLEIFTRFSVPIFFFVSAFGLFRQHPPAAGLDYGPFFRRRLKSVLVPYLVWSLLYMAHDAWITGESTVWLPPHIYEYLFFGLASYQLYFLVILIWFYLLMPLWRIIVPALAARPIPALVVILVLQIGFNYWSCYYLTADTENYYLRLAIEHRLSFLVLHYIFVFLLGGVCAVRLPKFSSLVARHRRRITAFFTVSLATMLAAYYWLLDSRGYLPEEAVNTIHQLSPVGVIYTLAACLFWFSLFRRPLPSWAAAPLSLLSRHSFAIYLVHPLIMYYLADYLTASGLAMTSPVVILFYVATMAASLLFGIALQRLTPLAPVVGLLLTGTSSRQIKPGT